MSAASARISGGVNFFWAASEGKHASNSLLLAGFENNRLENRPFSMSAGEPVRRSAPTTSTRVGCSRMNCETCNRQTPINGYKMIGSTAITNNVRRSRNWSRTSRAKISLTLAKFIGSFRRRRRA